MYSMKTLWLRDETLFIAVASQLREAAARWMRSEAVLELLTGTCVEGERGG